MMNTVALAATLLASGKSPNITVIPFHMIGPNLPLIMVPVKLNDTGPYDFIVDTGNAAMPILLSNELCDKLKLETKPHKRKDKGFAIDLSEDIKDTQVSPFGLGELSIPKVDAGVATAIDELAARLHAKIDGNIGYGFLKDYSIAIDYHANTLTLSDKPTVTTGVDFTIGKKTPLILIDVLVNGKAMKFALDTGASASCISPEAAKEVGLKKGMAVSPNGGKGTTVFLSTADSIKVGDQEQKKNMIVIADFLDKLSETAEVHVDGVLGYTFCKNYRLTVDYLSHKVELLPY
jgi:hypothetical protein